MGERDMVMRGIEGTITMRASRLIGGCCVESGLRHMHEAPISGINRASRCSFGPYHGNQDEKMVVGVIFSLNGMGLLAWCIERANLLENIIADTLSSFVGKCCVTTLVASM
jgi:hypothetical protein